mgnify:FL=1
MAIQEINWSEIIGQALKSSAKAWEAEFLAANKTTEERIAALNKLKREADLEWKALMTAKTDPFRYAVDPKDLRADYEHWKWSLTPLPKSQYVYTTDRYKITRDGKIIWNTRYFKDHMNRDDWQSDTKLTGEDFFTSRWSSSPTAVLYKNLQSTWLLGMFKKGEGNAIKQVTEDWSKWFKSLKLAETEAWKSSFRGIVDNTKSKLLETVDSIAGISRASERYRQAATGIRQDISDALGELRETYTGLITSTINDTLDNLKELGTKAINGVKAQAYDWTVKAGKRSLDYLRDRFGNVAGKLNGLVPTPILRVLAPANKILGGTLGKIASRLGLGRWLSDVKGESQYQHDAITNSKNVHSQAKLLTQITAVVEKEDYAHKRLTENLQMEWEKDQLVTIGMDLRNNLAYMLEDFGYVNTIIRSLNFARNFHFVNRPVLESETNSYYRTYAFFTRPNLNLFIDGKLNPSLDQYPEMKAIVLTDPGLYAELCRDGAYKSNLFKLLNNYTKEVAPPRLSETNREGIMNMHGKSMPTPGIPEIYGENDISVTFMDNNRGDIAKLLYFLSMYKEYTAKQGFPMRSEYIKYKGLDYLMSLYIVSVDMNWNMINFAVAYSLIPPEPPTHLAQHKLDGMSKNEYMEDINMTFKCTTFIPYAPDQCDVFNVLSGFNVNALVDTQGADGTTLLATGRTAKTILSEGKSERKPLFRSSFKERTSEQDRGDEPAFPFKGLFEMMAISPGFYRMSQVSKDNMRDTRLNIKFGFSS